MRAPLLVVMLVCGVVVAIGCGSDDAKCGSGGTVCDGGSGGTGGGGEGGTGGTGGDPGTIWTDVEPGMCTQEQASKAINTGLWQETFSRGAFPRLDVGSSTGATVQNYDDGMTTILLKTDAGTSVTVKWAGVLGEFAVASKVTLEQTRDWTIIRNKDLLAAMFVRNGEIPGEVLEPVPFGGPALRFALQCTLSKDNPDCIANAVELRSGSGAGLQVYETSDRFVIGENWRVHNRSVLQSASCTQDPTRFRSMIVVEGRPNATR